DWLRDREGQVQRVRAALVEPPRGERSPPRPAPETVAQEEGPPRKAAGRPPASANYESINDVPEEVVRRVVCRLLRDFGATEANDPCSLAGAPAWASLWGPGPWSARPQPRTRRGRPGSRAPRSWQNSSASWAPMTCVPASKRAPSWKSSAARSCPRCG